jgi:hypothetical protein
VVPPSGNINKRKYSRQKARRTQCSYYRYMLLAEVTIVLVVCNESDSFSDCLSKSGAWFYVTYVLWNASNPHPLKSYWPMSCERIPFQNDLFPVRWLGVFTEILLCLKSIGLIYKPKLSSQICAPCKTGRNFFCLSKMQISGRLSTKTTHVWPSFRALAWPKRARKFEFT